MYTDWGNLKIVRCRAWFQGLDPAAQRSAGGMDALGASIFTFKRTRVLPDTMKVPDWAMPKFSGTVESAFDSEAMENSPSGLWRTPGTRVGLTPSGVQIPHSPPEVPRNPADSGASFLSVDETPDFG